MPIFTIPLHEQELQEFNDCHEPAGSGVGGRFCSGDGAAWPLADDAPREFVAYPAALEKQWLGQLSTDEKTAIEQYTVSAQFINNGLRKDPQHVTPFAQHIQAALRKAPSPPPPALVWRRVDAQNKVLDSVPVGGVVTLNGFQSATIHPAALEYVSSRVLEIRPKAGAFIDALSANTYEYEFLLPHGLEYRVRGRKTVKIAGRDVEAIQLDML